MWRGAMGTANKSRAAIYVRMSTEIQNYSTDHQRSKIRAYAVNHGLHIAREGSGANQRVG